MPAFFYHLRVNFCHNAILLLEQIIVCAFRASIIRVHNKALLASQSPVCTGPSSLHMHRPMPPRPCLKPLLGSESSSPEHLPFALYPKVLSSPHVHFPPTPTLTSTHPAYSPLTYDRAPIAVTPNSCALPERGGRMYTSPSESWTLRQAKGSYFHPQAYEACEPEPYVAPTAPSTLPQLILDLSSESDESDGPIITLPDSSSFTSPISLHFTHSHGTRHSPIPHAQSLEQLDNALYFLPHPPSPVKDMHKGRKRRSLSRPRLKEETSRRDVGGSDAFALDGCLGGF
jgi:hypothetical protein